MQPYFFPYIGYFQLISSVDLFILYDNIKYTKKGWINRNRLLLNGDDGMFSLPLKKASDTLDIQDRELAKNYNPDKLLNQIVGAYRKSQCFDQVFPMIEQIMRFHERNLFAFLYYSLTQICAYLGITTELRTSSSIAIDHSLRNQSKVLAMCEAVGAATYVNAIGGLELYSREVFLKRGVELKFIQPQSVAYKQFAHEFVPWLSILDVMMFNPPHIINNRLLSAFVLI